MLRKAASMSALTHGAVQTTESLGRGLWHAAKTVGGGNRGGAAVLAGTGIAAAATVPQMAHAGREAYSTVHDPQTALARGGMK